MRLNTGRNNDDKEKGHKQLEAYNDGYVESVEDFKTVLMESN